MFNILILSLVFYHHPAGLHSRGCRSSGDLGIQTLGESTKELFHTEDVSAAFWFLDAKAAVCLCFRRMSCLPSLAQQQSRTSRRTMGKIQTSQDCGTLQWAQYATQLNKWQNVSHFTNALCNMLSFLSTSVKMLWILQLLRLRGLSVLCGPQPTIPTTVLSRRWTTV